MRARWRGELEVPARDAAGGGDGGIETRSPTLASGFAALAVALGGRGSGAVGRAGEGRAGGAGERLLVAGPPPLR